VVSVGVVLSFDFMEARAARLSQPPSGREFDQRIVLHGLDWSRSEAMLTVRGSLTSKEISRS
jgi:hypothetical protein